MKNQYQNLIEEQRNESIKLFQKPKSCLIKHLVPGEQIHYNLN